MSPSDPDEHTHELVAQHASDNDPTAWFETLYTEAADGRAIVPWDRDQPSALVHEWLTANDIRGYGKSAVVVGCGYGRDSELVARHGFRTTGFDVAPTAIEEARTRHAGSSVTYEIADLLALPEDWAQAFDLVIESMNVQALPIGEVRAAATAGVTSLVAPGGTLFVVAVARDAGGDVDGPPWPLDRAEVEAFGAGLTTRTLERIPDATDPDLSRWRAEFVREF